MKDEELKPKNGKNFTIEEIEEQMRKESEDDDYQKQCAEFERKQYLRRKKGWKLSIIFWVLFTIIVVVLAMLRVDLNWGYMYFGFFIISALIYVIYIDDNDNGGSSSGGFMTPPRNPRWLRRKIRQKYIHFR